MLGLQDVALLRDYTIYIIERKEKRKENDSLIRLQGSTRDAEQISTPHLAIH